MGSDSLIAKIRVSTHLRLEASQRFTDGSYLAQVYDHADRRRERGMTVRVMEYVLDDPGRPGDTRYRLLSNILEPARAPAPELAALYPQRWEFETILDELKIHQRGPRVVLRSKFPDGVYQEAYGYLLPTTRSVPSCMTPLSRRAWIPTASPSYAAYGW